MSSADRTAAADELVRVARTLASLNERLAEVDAIGLWSKSDDSSDNRRKRQGLREADWDASYVNRVLAEFLPLAAETRAELQPLADAAAELQALIEPLAGLVTDTMGIHYDLDVRLSHAREKAAELQARAAALLANCRA
ncbi:MAG TPA: hypothetical protein VF710_19405 [Longimicrobium sp.]